MMHFGNLLRRGVEFSVDFTQEAWDQVRPLRENGDSIGLGCVFWMLFEYLTIERDT
jgi:hypothetical protein